MAETFLNTQVRYVKNTTGETTDVLIPLELWKKMITSLRDPVSGLAWIDEHEPKAQLLSDLQISLNQAAEGKISPISELWNDIDD